MQSPETHPAFPAWKNQATSYSHGHKRLNRMLVTQKTYMLKITTSVGLRTECESGSNITKIIMSVHTHGRSKSLWLSIRLCVRHGMQTCAHEDTILRWLTHPSFYHQRRPLLMNLYLFCTPSFPFHAQPSDSYLKAGYPFLAFFF